MKTRSPGSASLLRQPLRLATLGASAFLLALALACGAADQPQNPAPQVSQAVQSSPSQPASQPRASAETSPGQEAPQEMPQDVAKVEPPAAANSDGQQSEPVMSRETTVDHPSGSQVTIEAKAVVGAKVEQTAEPKPETMVKTMDSHPATKPSSSSAVSAAPQQESTGDMKEVTVTPAGESAPEPTAEPHATEVPVVNEPMAEVGNQVGNRIPDFALDLVGGATVSTVNLVEESKPTFLFFTSTT